jgi:hypothetical protein
MPASGFDRSHPERCIDSFITPPERFFKEFAISLLAE